MNPDFQLMLMGSFVTSLFILAFVFYRVSKKSRLVSANNRTLAREAVKGLIEEMSAPSRHRWIETPQGEMIQFIYLLLGRSQTRSETGHLIWAEVNLRRNGAMVNLFHVVEVPSDDDFLDEIAIALRTQGWTVNFVMTDSQPNLAHTGVH